MMSIRHTGFVVADLERAINFYSKIFGFKLVARATETGAYIETLVGLSGACVEWAKMTDSDDKLLELLCYHSHPDILSKSAVSRRDISHIALTVPNIDESVRLLVAAGGTAGTIQQNPEKTVKVVYAHDLEGILIELVEVLPS